MEENLEQSNQLADIRKASKGVTNRSTISNLPKNRVHNHLLDTINRLRHISYQEVELTQTRRFNKKANRFSNLNSVTIQPRGGTIVGTNFDEQSRGSESDSDDEE